MTVQAPERPTTLGALALPGLERKVAATEAAAPSIVDIDEAKGIVTAIVSVTGVRDNVGDKITPGAYKATLTKRIPKGCWSHSWTDWVSRTNEIKELLPGDPGLPKKTKDGKPWPKEAGGLRVVTQFNMKSARCREAFEAVRFFSETGECEWSVGYLVPKGKAVKTKDGRDINEMDLYEYSPVLFGAHSLTGTLSTKSLATNPPDDEAIDDPTDEDVEDPSEEAEERLHKAGSDGIDWDEVDAALKYGDGTATRDEVKALFHREALAAMDPAMRYVTVGYGPADVEVKAGKKRKPRKCKYCEDKATKQTLWADGRARIVTCDDHTGMAANTVKRQGDEVTAVKPYDPDGDGDDDSNDPTDAADTATKSLWLADGTEVKLAGQEATPADVRATERLKAWYVRGGGAAKIRWGTDGDWQRCVDIAGKHMEPEQAKGFCNLRHHDATGAYPGHAPGEHPAKGTKALDPLAVIEDDDDGTPDAVDALALESKSWNTDLHPRDHEGKFAAAVQRLADQAAKLAERADEGTPANEALTAAAEHLSALSAGGPALHDRVTAMSHSFAAREALGRARAATEGTLPAAEPDLSRWTATPKAGDSFVASKRNKRQTKKLFDDVADMHARLSMYHGMHDRHTTPGRSPVPVREPALAGVKVLLRVETDGYDPALEDGPLAGTAEPDVEFKAAAEPEVKAMPWMGGPALPDSYEARRQAIAEAAIPAFQGLPLPNPTSDWKRYEWPDVSVTATFDDYAIITRTNYGASPTPVESFSVPYEVADDGTVRLGEPTPVTLSVVTVVDGPKGSVATKALGLDEEETAPYDGTAALPEMVLDVADAVGRIVVTAPEAKAGRVLSGLNSTRLQAAVQHLIYVLKAAGVPIDTEGDPEKDGPQTAQPSDVQGRDTTAPGLSVPEMKDAAVIPEGKVLLDPTAFTATMRAFLDTVSTDDD